MQEQLDYFKTVVQTRDKELRHKDQIIAALTERIPELEPAKDSSPGRRESPVSPSDNDSKVEGAPERERPSWWRRLFGVEH